MGEGVIDEDRSCGVVIAVNDDQARPLNSYLLRFYRRPRVLTGCRGLDIKRDDNLIILIQISADWYELGYIRHVGVIAGHSPARIVVIASLVGDDPVSVEENGDVPPAFSRSIREVEVEESCQHPAWHRRTAQVHGTCGAVTHRYAITHMIGILKLSGRVDLECLLGCRAHP